MMRQSLSALRLLQRTQEARHKLEADSAACDRAAWTEHCAIGLMAQALAPLSPQATPAAPAPANAGETGIAEPQAPLPMSAPQPRPEPVEEAELDALAEAEHYAIIYPERAALIRRLGRVPHNASFGPPDPDLVQALITARTPALIALDREFVEARAV